MKAIHASVFSLDGDGVGIPDSNLAYGTRHPKARHRVRSIARAGAAFTRARPAGSMRSASEAVNNGTRFDPQPASHRAHREL